MAEAPRGAKYVPDQPCANGHRLRYANSGMCVLCVRENNARMTARLTPRARADQVQKYRREHPEQHLLTVTRRRSRLEHLPFNLVVADIVFPERCPICGEGLAFGRQSRWAGTSPTLARIKRASGYIRGNVAIVCSRCAYLIADRQRVEQVAAWLDTQ